MGFIEAAEESGARVVQVAEKGCGAALHAGIIAANSKWVLFADADDSYHIDELSVFIPALENDADLVVSNCFFGKNRNGCYALATPLFRNASYFFFKEKIV